MAKYYVRVIRSVYSSVVVDAHNMKEANEKGLREVLSNPNATWSWINEEPKADCCKL